MEQETRDWQRIQSRDPPVFHRLQQGIRQCGSRAAVEIASRDCNTWAPNTADEEPVHRSPGNSPHRVWQHKRLRNWQRSQARMNYFAMPVQSICRADHNNINNEKLVLRHKMSMQTQQSTPLCNLKTRNQTSVSSAYS